MTGREKGVSGGWRKGGRKKGGKKKRREGRREDGEQRPKVVTETGRAMIT